MYSTEYSSCAKGFTKSLHAPAYRQHIQKRDSERYYPTSLWACFTAVYGGHDLCNDIHMFEASFLAVCGHIAIILHVV